MKHLTSVLSLLLAAGPVLAAGAEPASATPAAAGPGTADTADAANQASRGALDLSLPRHSGESPQPGESPVLPTDQADRKADPAAAAVGDYAPAYIADPPGTYYGDRSGRAAPSSGVLTREAAACDGQLHGSVSLGTGYSRRGGNSNWQATNLNTCKRYVSDSGKERQLGLSISVGQGSGPGFRGGYGGPGGYYGHDAGYHDGRYDGDYDGVGGPGPGWRGMPPPAW